jgi:hypothetical protein
VRRAETRLAVLAAAEKLATAAQDQSAAAFPMSKGKPRHKAVLS